MCIVHCYGSVEDTTVGRLSECAPRWLSRSWRIGSQSDVGVLRLRKKQCWCIRFIKITEAHTLTWKTSQKRTNLICSCLDRGARVPTHPILERQMDKEGTHTHRWQHEGWWSPPVSWEQGFFIVTWGGVPQIIVSHPYVHVFLPRRVKTLGTDHCSNSDLESFLQIQFLVSISLEAYLHALGGMSLHHFVDVENAN
jgi:hypothetical protein